MRERPILFSPPMVRAILDGRKTQTRRIVKKWPTDAAVRAKAGTGYDFMSVRDQEGYWKPVGPIWAVREVMGVDLLPIVKCPYGKKGDRLIVRESFARVSQHYAYRAEADDDGFLDYGGTKFKPEWKPSIHMPYEASRITLEITGVELEHLQDISLTKAAKEGVGLSVENFRHLWQKINGAESWDSNPFVWVIEFKRFEVEYEF